MMIYKGKAPKGDFVVFERQASPDHAKCRMMAGYILPGWRLLERNELFQYGDMSLQNSGGWRRVSKWAVRDKYIYDPNGSYPIIRKIK